MKLRGYTLSESLFVAGVYLVAIGMLVIWIERRFGPGDGDDDRDDMPQIIPPDPGDPLSRPAPRMEPEVINVVAERVT